MECIPPSSPHRYSSCPCSVRKLFGTWVYGNGEPAIAARDGVLRLRTGRAVIVALLGRVRIARRLPRHIDKNVALVSSRIPSDAVSIAHISAGNALDAASIGRGGTGDYHIAELDEKREFGEDINRVVGIFDGVDQVVCLACAVCGHLCGCGRDGCGGGLVDGACTWRHLAPKS